MTTTYPNQMKTKVTLMFDTPEEAAFFVKLLRPEIAIIEQAELPLLPLVVGGVYLNGFNYEVEIVSKDEHDKYQFADAEGFTYTEEGQYSIGEESRQDLIKRIR